MAASILACVAGVGCSGNAARQDRADERDPYYRRAQARQNVQDIDGAIQLYQKALERRPELGRAHFELGMLYEQYSNDYIRAIYHYQRYLELRPTAEKKKMVEDTIWHLKLAFAASLPAQPSAAVQEIAMMRQEIESLKAELKLKESAPVSSKPVPARATTTASANEKTPSASAALTPPSPQPLPAQPAVESYVVQPGDTLSKIAGKVYRDTTKWEQIYNANRGTLASPQSVRPGQTLKIPKN